MATSLEKLDAAIAIRNLYAAILSQAILDAKSKTVSQRIQREARRWLSENAVAWAELIHSLGGPQFNVSKWLKETKYPEPQKQKKRGQQPSESDIAEARSAVLELLWKMKNMRLSIAVVAKMFPCQQQTLRTAIFDDNAASYFAKRLDKVRSVFNALAEAEKSL